MCVCVCKTNWKGDSVKNPVNIKGRNLRVLLRLDSNAKHSILTLETNIQHLNFLGSEAWLGLFSLASTESFSS